MKMGAHLTGRTRYRPNYWGTKFILQVEEEVTRCYLGPFPGGTKQVEWRDARISDFSLLDIKQPAPCPGDKAQDTKTET